jgi:hypothetical protein
VADPERRRDVGDLLLALPLLVFTGSRAFGLDRLLAFRSVTAAGPASDPVTA